MTEAEKVLVQKLRRALSDEMIILYKDGNIAASDAIEKYLKEAGNESILRFAKILKEN